MSNVLGNSFSTLFKRYRLLANFPTLNNFADALADEGLLLDTTILSRWQTGERIPHDRETLLIIIKILQKQQALLGIDEANCLLESAGFGFLTDREAHNIFPNLVKTILPTNIFSRPQLDAEIITQAPAIIQGLRIQGHIPLAIKLAQYFEQQILDNINPSKFQFKILAEVYAHWSRTMSDSFYTNEELDQSRQLSRRSLKIAENIGDQTITNLSLYNLACTEYIAENWNLSKELLTSKFDQVTDEITKVEMIIILLFDFAHLNDLSTFNHYRGLAENLVTDLKYRDIYHADSLLEAISRGLAIMYRTDESRKIASQIMFPQERPFLTSQMIKHQLITLNCEAKIGKLIDGAEVAKLEMQAANPKLAVFCRHQCQIKELIKDIRSLIKN